MSPHRTAKLSDEEQNIALTLWNDYKDIMYKIAYDFFKNKSDAEDAVHDTYLRMLDHIDKFYGEKATNTKGLVFIYIKGTCINNYNKSKRHFSRSISMCNENDEMMDILDAQTQTPDIALESKEVASKVVKHISQLDDKYKDVLILKYYYGYKDYEIAEALGITINNVGVRAHRARELLAKSIKNSNDYEILEKGWVKNVTAEGIV